MKLSSPNITRAEFLPKTTRSDRTRGLKNAVRAACDAFIEALEPRRLLSLTPINANSATPFNKITIDPNPGSVPVVKVLGDLLNNGYQDAIIGHETTLGGGGLDWYQYPASGNPNDPWIEHVIDPTADCYEQGVATNISGHVDSHGKPVMDIIMEERGSVYWYENPLGDGGNPTTGTWTKHLIGTITQGSTHEMYLADLDGDGKLDVVTNTAIFFQNSSTSWTEVANPTYNRTQKGLYLFNSGSGLGSVDLLGTGEGPNYQVGWYQNPRDKGGSARTGQWTFHAIGPAYGNFANGDGISYAAMDVNGDGRQDIITCDGENGNPPNLAGGLIWWQAPANDVTGTWTEHTIDTGVTDVHNLVIADINGDGTPDLLCFEQDQSPLHRLMIAYNVGGTGTDWQEQTIGTEGAHNEKAADIDGDGTVDVLTSPHGAYTGYNPIEVYMNQLSADGIVAPTITSSPISQSAAVGQSVTFSVNATGTGPFAYDWQFNNVPIAGASSSTYTISAAQAANAGQYRCVVSNGHGFIPSSAATLLIGPSSNPSASLATPAAVTIGGAASQSVTLQVTYLGIAPIDVSTLNNDDLQITGPGFTAGATFQSVDGNTGSDTRVATYTLSPPVGGWSSSNNGSFMVSVVANQVSDTSGHFVLAGPIGGFNVSIASQGGGALVATQATAASSYNLTRTGALDWAHWGRGGASGNFDRSATGNSQISNVTRLGTGGFGGYTDASRSVNWTNGTPTKTDSADSGYIWANNATGAGYSFTVPADTTTRTLYVYAGGYSSGAQLTAHLSDGSAADYVASASGNSIFNEIYTITYSAAAAGQTLTISYVKSQNINGTGGSADLIAAMLATPAVITHAPAIVTNPQSQSITVGQEAIFTAAASGTPTPTVQWMVEASGGNAFSAIKGATSTTLDLGAAALVQSGNQYEAVFSNGVGSAATTSAATLTVTGIAPVVTSNPSDLTVDAGGDATFTAAATGTPTPTVQWMVQTAGATAFSPIPGATATTLDLGAATPQESGSEYEAVFRNGVGTAATTTAATLTVNTAAPVVTANPTDVTTDAGTDATFTAAATGTPTPTVQWMVEAAGHSTFSLIAGATSTTLDVGPATPQESGNQYEAVFSNGVGTAATTTAATLTVNTAAPVVTTNPTDLTTDAGTDATFTAAATGTPTPTVQWMVETAGANSFSPIAGATATTLDLGTATPQQSGNEYEAVFSNGVGTAATTSAATLTVNTAAPVVTTNPTDLTVTAGTDATFAASATGLPKPTVQWLVETVGGNGFVAIAGATATTLDLGAATLAESGNQYEAVFTNGVGTPATSSAATLTVNGTAPKIVTNPISQNLSTGKDATFTAAASGLPTPTIQWMVEAAGASAFSPIAGATSTTLDLGAATLAQSGNQYEAVFSNGFASPAVTTPATLTVTAVATGTLTGSLAKAASSYNLNTLGTSDWAHWGRGGNYGLYDHSATGNSQISNVTRLGAGSVGGYTDSSRSVNWTNGTPTKTNTGDRGYIWANNALGAGFSFTVPADTTTRTLYVYAGGYSSGGQLTAHLSGGSAADYVVSSSGSAIYTNLYTITYAAPSAGQTLTISYVKTQNIAGSGGSIDLIAAMLSVAVAQPRSVSASIVQSLAAPAVSVMIANAQQPAGSNSSLPLLKDLNSEGDVIEAS